AVIAPTQPSRRSSPNCCSRTELKPFRSHQTTRRAIRSRSLLTTGASDPDPVTSFNPLPDDKREIRPTRHVLGGNAELDASHQARTEGTVAPTEDRGCPLPGRRAPPAGYGSHSSRARAPGDLARKARIRSASTRAGTRRLRGLSARVQQTGSENLPNLDDAWNRRPENIAYLR